MLPHLTAEVLGSALFQVKLQSDLGEGIVVNVLTFENSACWFGMKFYVTCEIRLVNYSNLLCFCLLPSLSFFSFLPVLSVHF